MVPHHHKALLSRCRSKFERLRRCISANSFFIFDMLQDIDDNDGGETTPSNHDVSIVFKPCQLTSRTHVSDTFQVAKAYVVEGSTTVCNVPIREEKREGHGGSINGSHTSSLEFTKDMHISHANNAIESNGNVLSSTRTWLDPSIQFEVPLVDVDKVRCIIRNIVRDWTVPDIHPASAGITEGFSMCGGDFLEVYNDSSQAESILRCFLDNEKEISNMGQTSL